MIITEMTPDILNEIRDGLFMTDDSGLITFVNEPLAKMHGLDGPEEMIGKHILDFVSAEFRTEILDRFKRAIQEESYSETMEFSTVRKDGGIIFVQLRHGPIVRKDRIVGTAGIVRDITDRKRTERALAASEKKYREIVENMTDVVYILDRTGKLLFITPSVTRMLGYEQSETIGHYIQEFTFQEDFSPALKNINNAILQKGAISNEYRLVRKDGGIIWIQTLTRPLFEENDVVGVQGSAWDITERKQAEEALRKSEERFRRYFELGLIGMVTSLPTKEIIDVNDETCRIFGYDREELLQKSWAELTHPDDLGADLAQFNRVLNGEIESYAIDKRFIRKDGKVIDASISVRAMRRADGSLECFFALLQNVTKRKRAEEALRESEEKFRSLVETTNDWIWEVDAEGVYTYASPRVRDLLGYEPEEVLGRKPFEFMPPEESARVMAEFSRIVKERKGCLGLENVNIRRDGRRVVLETSCVPRLDARGNLLGFRGIDRDITDRKRAEEALKRSHDGLELRVAQRTAELERKNQELQEFALVAAHDLSEPLRKIQTMGSYLSARKADLLDDEGKDYISRMRDAAKRTRELLDALLGYARIESKGQEFAPVRLNDVAKEAIGDLEVKARKIGANVEVGPLPTVMGDPNQLRQLFQNLIGNALKYHRTVVIPCVKIYAEEDKKDCRIFVEDNGIGFDEKYLDKVFKPFQRLHRSDEYLGTGIGLAIGKKITERHGGKITAKSTPGEGSTFIVTLPRSVKD